MIGNFIELGLGGNGSVSEIDEPKLYFNLKSFLKAGLEVKKKSIDQVCHSNMNFVITVLHGRPFAPCFPNIFL